MEEDYTSLYERLQTLSGKLARDLRSPMAAFAQLNGATLMPGALDTKTKHLIGLGIAIAARCEGCIAIHVHDALRAGADRDDILETLGIAVMMGGGPAMIFACRTLEALDQFTAAEPSTGSTHV